VVTLTSARSSGSIRELLSKTRVTSARPRPGRVAVPAKMTSSIFAVRSAFGDWVPITQAMASTTFDLPDPFGPTTTVTPGRNSRRVRSAKDLNPVSFNDLRYMRIPRPIARTRCSGWWTYTCVIRSRLADARPGIVQSEDCGEVSAWGAERVAAAGDEHPHESADQRDADPRGRGVPRPVEERSPS
jgi:hypothetical protein